MKTKKFEHVYLYRGIYEKPYEGYVVTSTAFSWNGGLFVRDGSPIEKGLKVSYKEGVVSERGFVWFTQKPHRRTVREAYSKIRVEPEVETKTIKPYENYKSWDYACVI